MKLKSSNISDNEIFEQVAGKENDIDERALVFIEQRYKVPFLQTLQQKHLPRNLKHRFNYRTFVSNTDSNDAVKHVFLHKFQESKRMPVRSHKDIYTGDKPKSLRDDILLKQYKNINMPRSFNYDDLPLYSSRKNNNNVNIVNSNLGHRFNDDALKDELVTMDLDRYDGDPLHHHDRLLRDQLITLKDHYRRAQDHENREKQLLKDIKAIKANIDTITAEHQEYLELLKAPNVKDVRTYSNKDFPLVKTESKVESLSLNNKLIKEHKTAVPSVTQFYAPPTGMVIKTSQKSPTIIENIAVEKEPNQKMPRQPQQLQQLQSVIQPAYLSNPPDIDFHDNRILSKIEEMNILSASIDKDKRSSSTATFSRSTVESNRTTRASEKETPCVYPKCLKNTVFKNHDDVRL